MNPLKCPETIPEWFSWMSPTARISSKDTRELFGFKDNSSLYASGFPKPNGTTSFMSGTTGKLFKQAYWTKGVLLKEIQRRQELNNSNPLKQQPNPTRRSK